MNSIKRLCLLALFTATSALFATIDLNITIRDVYVDGTCEETGIITMVAEADEFQDASTQEPVYIRLRLDHGAKLCKTLVWSNSANAGNLTFNPIFLPIRFDSFQLGDTVAALPETISIVRWKRGEDEIWLRVQTPTETWIGVGAGTIAPTTEKRCAWTVGITARTSWGVNSPDFAIGRANLPSATRDVTDLTTTGAVSTLICVDLTDSNLEPRPAPQEQSVLNFDPVAFDFGDSSNVETASTANQIIQVPQAGISFSDDRTIARGYDFLCTGGPIGKGDGPRFAPLCFVPGQGQGGADNGLVSFSNSIDVRISCGAGWGFHNNSLVRLDAPVDSRYGFLVLLDDEGDPIDQSDLDPGFPINTFVALNGALNIGSDPENSQVVIGSSAYGTRSSMFAIQGGDFLTRDAEVSLVEGGTDGTKYVRVNATVCMFYTEDPTDVFLQASFYASNRNEHFDIAPFDGVDQPRFCDPSLRLAVQFEWYFGAFLPCRSTDCARIFFPYQPRVFGTEFFTGLSYVNHGSGDLDSVTAHIYESDGSYWTVDFPELPVRNQFTALLVDDADNGVGFIAAEGDEAFYPPVSQDGDTTFGDLRSSMFVVGCIELDELGASGADLDGYLLIGNGIDVTGSYTARNTEPGVTQEGDLPVLYDKRNVGTRKYVELPATSDMNNHIVRKFVR